MRAPRWFAKLRSRDARNEQPAAAGAQKPPGSGDGRASAIGGEANTYSADQPIDSEQKDRFGRWPFAKRIADTIARRTDPNSLVLGLYGQWGDGKTSTLLLMQKALKDYPGVVVVRFNPWHFGSEQQLLTGFFTSLADALGRSLSTWREDIGKALQKYGGMLSVASISIAGAVQISPGEGLKSLGEGLSSVELEELRRRVEAFLAASKARVVVLIDDIDRLDRAEIHAIFKLVKLSANFQFTAYVLAFDDEMVAASLGEKYGGGGAAAGRSFLEKIIQVPLHLPPPDSTALRKLTFEGVDAALSVSGIDLPANEAQAFGRYFVDGIEPQLRTPRQAKLYANALAFALPLLNGEARMVDLMLMEGVRLFYPVLYEAIRENPELFLKSPRDNGQYKKQRERLDALISGALENADGSDTEWIRRRVVEYLFPRTGNTGYDSEWDLTWSREQRICSYEYFQRYFTYSVPPGDVGDLEIENFLASAELASEIDRQLKAWAERSAMPRVITKLRYKEDTIDPSLVGVLVLGIARNGSLLPRERGMLSIGGTFAQGAILISQLLRRVASNGERLALAVQVLQTAVPLPFADQCFRWMRRSDRKPEEQQLLSEDAECTAGRTLADRIYAEAQQGALWSQYGQDAPYLYWVWSKYRGHQEVRTLMQSWIDVEDVVDKLLDGYVGESWGMETGLSERSDFSRESYDDVAKYLDPHLILEKLRGRYGQQLDDPQFYHSPDVPFPLRVAHQFAFIHNAVLKGKQSAMDAGTPTDDS